MTDSNENIDNGEKAAEKDARQAAKKEALRSYLQLIKVATTRPLADDELANMTRMVHEHNIGGYDRLLGTKFIAVEPQRIVTELEITRDHLQPWGLTNGGVYCSLGETAGSVAGYIAAGAALPVVGVNNNTDFYRSAVAGDTVITTATPVHLGSTFHVWGIEHRRKADDKVLARTNLRLAVLTEEQAARSGKK